MNPTQQLQIQRVTGEDLRKPNQDIQQNVTVTAKDEITGQNITRSVSLEDWEPDPEMQVAFENRKRLTPPSHPVDLASDTVTWIAVSAIASRLASITLRAFWGSWWYFGATVVVIAIIGIILHWMAGWTGQQLKPSVKRYRLFLAVLGLTLGV